MHMDCSNAWKSACRVVWGGGGGGYSALSKERGEKWVLGAAGWDETRSSIT